VRSGNGDLLVSSAGHAWFEVINPDGKSFQSGFGPSDPKTTVAAAPGSVSDNDGDAYIGTPAFTASYQITQTQADALEQFHDDPTSLGFDKENYHALTNSCVDYVWKALENIGMNAGRHQGKLRPMENRYGFSILNNPEISGGGLVLLEKRPLTKLGMLNRWFFSDYPTDSWWPGESRIGFEERDLSFDEPWRVAKNLRPSSEPDDDSSTTNNGSDLSRNLRQQAGMVNSREFRPSQVMGPGISANSDIVKLIEPPIREGTATVGPLGPPIQVDTDTSFNHFRHSLSVWDTNYMSRPLAGSVSLSSPSPRIPFIGAQPARFQFDWSHEFM